MHKALAVTAVIFLFLVSGCISGNIANTNSTITDDCAKTIAELPKIISTNTEGARAFEAARVVDGDTFELSDGSKVRMNGINTPEHNEPNYAEAKQNLADLILNRSIYLQKDVSDTDKYGRKLRYVFTEDKFANAEQVSSGLASSFEYPPDTKYLDLFECLEKDARQKQLGMWKGYGSNLYNISISITQNPDTSKNPNDEFIVIKNNGAEIDMAGWQMKDEATHIYTFNNTLLGTGESVTIYSGKGSDYGNVLYWDLDTTVWNNDGDTVFLRDSEDNLAAIYEY
jgi:endonuclease YncB( thermonuclease family)